MTTNVRERWSTTARVGNGRRRRCLDLSTGTSINSRGQMAGGAATTGDTSLHAIRISNGVMSDLGTLGGTFSFAEGINERGDVAGVATLHGDQVRHAFLWSGGTMTDLWHHLVPAAHSVSRHAIAVTYG